MIRYYAVLSLAISSAPTLASASCGFGCFHQLQFGNVQPVYHCLPGDDCPAVVDSSGDAKLDEAMSICRSHRHLNGLMISTNPPQDDYYYEAQWGACSKIEDKWGRSRAGQAERERAAKEKRDLDLVNSLASEGDK